MANPQKGEVIVKVGEGEFILVYTMGALAAIEGQFDGRPFQEVLAEFDGDTVPAQTVIVVAWAGLKKHHGLTLDEVGDILVFADLPVWGQKIGEAFKLAQPAAQKGKGTRPRKAPAV